MLVADPQTSDLFAYPQAIALRAATEADRRFLFEVFVSSREREFRDYPLPQADLGALLEMQFEMQSRHYRAQFPTARNEVVLLEGQPAGRLYVDRREETIHLIDVALLAPYRNQGAGTRILSELIREAAACDLPMRLSVRTNNPARALYERLGFQTIGASEAYFQMEKRPQ